MSRIDRFQRPGLLAFLILMGALFSFLSPYFFTWENLTNILVQSAVLLIVGTGMTLVIATAGIDLSVGSILALSGIVMAAAMKAGLGVFAGMALGVFAGAVMGLLNGLGNARLGISPFIVTLGTAGIYRALALIFTDARPIYGLPMEFRIIGTGRLGPIPLSAVLAFAVLGLAYFLSPGPGSAPTPVPWETIGRVRFEWAFPSGGCSYPSICFREQPPAWPVSW